MVLQTEQQEIVIILNTENLPWFLNIFLKHKTLSVSWHIHSSISNAKVAKVKAFFKKFQDLYQLKPESKINLRLIFKSGKYLIIAFIIFINIIFIVFEYSKKWSKYHDG